MYYYHQSFLGWVLMSMHIVIPVLFIILVSRFFNKKQGDNTITSPKTPLGTLKERYARGDINKDEFYRIKDEINS